MYMFSKQVRSVAVRYMCQFSTHENLKLLIEQTKNTLDFRRCFKFRCLQSCCMKLRSTPYDFWVYKRAELRERNIESQHSNRRQRDSNTYCIYECYFSYCRKWMTIFEYRSESNRELYLLLYFCRKRESIVSI